MATYYAVAAGNFNATSTWSTTPAGAPGFGPPIAGDTAISNNRAVAVTASATCLQVRNDATGGATAGGTFTLSDGITLTANILGGTTAVACVTANPSTNIFIVGNVTGGTGGSTSAHGVVTSTNTGTLTITGNLTGGAGLSSGTAAVSNVAATLVVVGNVTGASNTLFGTGEGIRLTGAGNCTITGNVTGGAFSTNYGVRATSTGNTTVVGQAIGGIAAPAINNESTGQVTVTRAVGNGFGGGSVGLSAAVGVSNVVSQSSITIVEEVEFGTLGQSPVNGRIRLKKASTNVAVFNYCDTAGAKTLIDATANAAMPAITDVRFGTVYASGALTGVAYIPAAGSVAFGVPVDNTTGTATLTAANVRAAIGLATANLDTQLAAIPTAAGNASAVRTELTPELTEITEVHAIHGLDIANALTVTPTSRTSGAITQAITGDGTTNTVVTRV
jgi:fibronectin-binding autotransporter adhesin